MGEVLAQGGGHGLDVWDLLIAGSGVAGGKGALRFGQSGPPGREECQKGGNEDDARNSHQKDFSLSGRW